MSLLEFIDTIDRVCTGTNLSRVADIQDPAEELRVIAARLENFERMSAAAVVRMDAMEVRLSDRLESGKQVADMDCRVARVQEQADRLDETVRAHLQAVLLLSTQVLSLATQVSSLAKHAKSTHEIAGMHDPELPSVGSNSVQSNEQS